MTKLKIAFISIAVIIIIVAVAACGISMNSKKSKSQKTEIISQASIEKIINVSNLSTFEAVYNGIAKISSPEDAEKIDYYVSYEAKVKAGIDFDLVEISVDNNAKNITVTLPEVKINDTNVDITSLDYIFLNDDANTENVSEQAYNKCIEDVKNESKTETAIYNIAEQNAKNILEALITPFVQQLDEEYELIIK